MPACLLLKQVPSWCMRCLSCQWCVPNGQRWGCMPRAIQQRKQQSVSSDCSYDVVCDEGIEECMALKWLCTKQVRSAGADNIDATNSAHGSHFRHVDVVSAVFASVLQMTLNVEIKALVSLVQSP
jgi:hypothetical protein